MGRERERQGEKYQYVVGSHVPPVGDLACYPGMCPDWELNQWPFGLQARAECSELHQPGLLYFLLACSVSEKSDIILIFVIGKVDFSPSGLSQDFFFTFDILQLECDMPRRMVLVRAGVEVMLLCSLHFLGLWFGVPQ